MNKSKKSPDGSPPDASTHKLSWEAIIRAVQTPLGFFALVVLVVDGMLSILTIFADSQRTLLISGILVLLVMLIITVALLAYLRPGVLESKQPEAIQSSIGAHLERIETELKRLDQIGRYGSSGALVAALFALEDNVRIRAHCRAGGLTITPLLLENLPKTVADFYHMLHGNQDELKITEHHLVDNFLSNLMKTLPTGSSWFGVTRLQSRDAWRRGTATVAYSEFQEVAETRTKDQELNYFRLWCFDDEDHFHRTEDILRYQQRDGFQVRFTIGEALEDISIIWIPIKETDKAVRIKDLNEPIDEIKDKLEGLCAIKFGHVRGGRELEEMTISTPRTEDFKYLCRYFQDNWSKASELPQSS